MVIFAQRSGSINLQGLLNQVRVDEVPTDGDILLWHEDSQSFIVRTPEKISGISDVETHGGANAISAVDKIVNDTIHFKEFISGSGINIETDDERIIINNTLSADRLSVPDSYEITIDNDASSSDARFEIKTAAVAVATPKVITFYPTVLPALVQNVYTAIESGSGTFSTINGYSFTSSGFVPGQFIFVENTHAQEGGWTVENVETYVDGGSGDTISKITVVEEFLGLAATDLGGPKLDISIIQLDLRVIEPDAGAVAPYDPLLSYEIESVTQNFGPGGHNLLPGMIVHISGSKDEIIDGAYVVDSVVAKGAGLFDYSRVKFKHTTPIESAGFVLPENTLVPALVMNVDNFEGTTDFWVREDGVVHARYLEVENEPVAPLDVANKDYVDNNAAKARTRESELYFIAFF